MNVSSNSAPEFVTDLRTQFDLDMYKEERYTLPDYSDPEGNDTPVLFLNSMDKQDFPDFIKFDNDTKTLIMEPNALKHQGRTFYFAVILKEANSDYMMNIYYVTCAVSGDRIDDEDLIFHKQKISMQITEITSESTGQLNFSKPVNFANVENRFLDIFHVYVKDVVKEI